MEVMAGNVVTVDAVARLSACGVDCIRVGIGSGSICTTRLVTGFGYPQLSAIINTSNLGVPIIADGGIRYSGDIVKALAAGASAVMVGRLLAGTNETNAPTIGRKCVYRGMSSASVNSENGKTNVAAEGIKTVVEPKGSVKGVLQELIGGIRSGLTYCGARNLTELRSKAKWVKITGASWNESLAH